MKYKQVSRFVLLASTCIVYCFLGSCLHTSNKGLDVFDENIDYNSEQALVALDSVNPNILSSADKKRYDLYRFIARMRNDDFSITEDSVKTILNNYSTDNLSRESMLAAFFYSCYLNRFEKNAEALEYLDKVIMIASELKDTLYIGLANLNKASIYGHEYMTAEEFVCSRKAFDALTSINDTTRMMYAYEGLAATYYHDLNYEEAARYYKELSNLALKAGDTIQYVAALHDLGDSQLNMEDYKSSLSTLLEAQRLDPSSMNAERYTVLADAYVQNGDKMMAEYYLHKAQSCLISTTDTLQWIETRWHILQSSQPNPERFALVDSIIMLSNNLTVKALSFNILHTRNELLQLEIDSKKALEAQQRKIFWLVFSIIGLLSCIAVYLVTTVILKYRERVRVQTSQVNELTDTLGIQISIVNEKETLLKNVTESYELISQQRSGWQQERRSLMEERNRLQKEKQMLQTERNNLYQERNQLQSERNKLDGENGKLQTEKGKLQEENTFLQEITSQLEEEKNYLQIEQECLRQQMSELSSSLWVSFKQTCKVANDILGINTVKYHKDSRILLMGQQKKIVREFNTVSTIEKMKCSLNRYQDNIIAKIESDLHPDQREMLILTYTLCGFSFRSIGMLLETNPHTISAIKSKLIDSLLNETPNLSLYSQYFSCGRHS